MDLSSLKKDKKEEAPAPAPEPTAPKQPEAEFQKYSSAMLATRMVTTGGKLIDFTNHTFITKDADCIAYLDAEIAAGLKGITKGDKVLSAEDDPMAALREKIIAEHEEQKRQEAAASALGKPLPDMGTTEDASGVTAATSEEVAD